MKIVFKYPAPAAPLPARALMSVFYRAYLHRETASAEPALKMLMAKIGAGKFRPHYSPEEIDGLFNKVLAEYANGRYLREKKLDSLLAWDDLLNNLSVLARSYRDILRFKNITPDEERDFSAKVRKGVIKFKIIEDWIYYHPEAMREVITD